jgi:predicted hotdog family 3-hydroxylacyl-ACP dehydratase
MKPVTNISLLIPQTAPFVMIDELLESDEHSATTQLLIRNDNVLVEDGYFQESGLIENIAQTAAAKVGYEAMIANTQMPKGFIGAVQQLEIFQLPQVNDTIQTEIIQENQIFNATLIA